MIILDYLNIEKLYLPSCKTQGKRIVDDYINYVIYITKRFLLTK